MSEAGKIFSFSMPFYNAVKGAMGYKARPALILHGPLNGDYTVLPISTLKNPKDRNADFDIQIDPADFPNLGLHDVSFIRIHKQTTVHQNEKYKLIGDMKKEYPQKFQEVLDKLDDFNKMVKNSI